MFAILYWTFLEKIQIVSLVLADLIFLPYLIKSTLESSGKSCCPDGTPGSLRTALQKRVNSLVSPSSHSPIVRSPPQSQLLRFFMGNVQKFVTDSGKCETLFKSQHEK
jgi:hypothetical protein